MLLKLELDPADLHADVPRLVAAGVERALPEVVEAGAVTILAGVRSALDSISRSGDLRASFGAVLSGETAVVRSSLPYARIVDQGGVVRARPGHYLTIHDGGRWARVRQVQIPARQYLRAGLDDAAVAAAAERVLDERLAREVPR